MKLAGAGHKFDDIPRPITCITWAAPHNGTAEYRTAVEVRLSIGIVFNDLLRQSAFSYVFLYFLSFDLEFGETRKPSIAAHIQQRRHCSRWFGFSNIPTSSAQASRNRCAHVCCSWKISLGTLVSIQLSYLPPQSDFQAHLVSYSLARPLFAPPTLFQWRR